MKKVIGLAFALVLFGAGPALAHVTANPGEVASGSFTVITFRVPNESDTASTVKLEVVFPEDVPFANARVKPTPGWEHSIERDGDRVGSITWEGGEIAPGEFQEFDVSLGPIPEVDRIEFGALQTYDDGEVVRWVEPSDGDEEPEHPAPAVSVVEGSGDHHGGTAAGADDMADDHDDDDGTDTVTFIALFLGGAALIAAVAALVVGRRRPPAV